MRIRTLPLATLALGGCLIAAAALQDGPREAGEEALRDRQWDKAEQLLGRAIEGAKDGRDELLYLQATAQQHGGKLDAGIATLDRLLADHPASPLRMKARFKKADLLAAKKDFAAAAGIVDGQVAALTAPDRRKRLAMTYVELARELFISKDPGFVPDPKSAAALLARAVEFGSLGDDEEAVRADLVACLRASASVDVLPAAREFERRFPQSRRMDEVLAARGEAEFTAKHPDRARAAWVRLADAFPASPLAAPSLLRAALLDAKEGAELPADLDALGRMLPLLRRLAKDFAAADEGARAAFLAARALVGFPETRDDGRRELRAFVEARPKHERAPHALLAIGDAFRQDHDEVQSIAAYEELQRRFPESPVWADARAGIPGARWDRLKRAGVRKDWPSLRTLASEFVDLHAADGRAVEASSLVGRAFLEEKKPREAVDQWLRTAARWPSAEEGHRARYEAAVVLADELGDFDGAVRELKKVAGQEAASAATFLKTLDDVSLSLTGERTYRTGEAPAATLVCRNVEKLKVRLWAVDLRDYFEKKAATDGLQTLEVAVIAPDQEWEFVVPGYARRKSFRTEIPLPKREPGAYVISASAGAQESTTVVLVSDLDLLAVAGRKSVAVLVRNQKTGEVVANATIRTAADGKALKAWTPETQAMRLSWLAEAGGHSAFRDLDASDLALPRERVATAVVTIDRDVVAEGEEIRIRTVVRDVAAGAWVVPQGKKYRLAAFSPKGVRFHDEDLTLSRAGAASSTVRLPSPLGYGRVAVRVFEVDGSREKPLGEAGTLIGAKRMPGGASFDLIVDERVFLAGDPVDAALVLRDATGRPMPGRRIQVTTPESDEAVERTTGADGTVAVALRDTSRFGPAWAQIRAEGEGVSGSFPIRFAPRRLHFDVDPAPPVVAGEARAVKVAVRRSDGTPAAVPFTWRAVRLTVAGEEIPVASGDGSSDAAGKAAVSIATKDAGRHVVRFIHVESDGLPRWAAVSFGVLGEADEEKLTILRDSDEVEPGKPFEVSVYSRLERGVAFVAVEGEKVESLAPVTLEKGRTVVKLGAPPTATRDFTVSVLRMEPGAFHVAKRDFRLAAAPVAIELAKQEFRPGETAEVRVKAAPGAEVALAVGERIGNLPAGPSPFLPSRPGSHFVEGSSADLKFTGRLELLSVQTLQAMEDVRQKPAQVRVMMPTESPAMEFYTFGVGKGGGGGGRYGGRFGGRENLVALGGGTTGKDLRKPMPVADEPPILWATVEAGPDGLAVFRVQLPPVPMDYSVVAWTTDASNGGGAASASLRARAAVDVDLRVPERALEGEKTSVAALLTNRTGAEQECVLGFGGAESRVKVPARSTVEKIFEWTAAPEVAVTVDGFRRDFRVEMRRPAVEIAEAGGGFAEATELTLGGAGPIRMRYAAGPAALMESLAEGRDGLTPLSDAAARVLAELARHRFEPGVRARQAVLALAALRAAGAGDARTLDPSGPVLAALAEAEAAAAGFEATVSVDDLKARFARAAGDDVKAVILCALARGGAAEYGYLHRLWRSPEALSPRALAAVALAFRSMGKADEAKAAAARLAAAARDDHWGAAPVAEADGANTEFGATALAAFALAEIEPAHPLLPKARAWLLGRAPRSAVERGLLALALRSIPERGAVARLVIGGKAVSGFGEVEVDRATVEPSAPGTYYVLARRRTDRPAAAEVAIERVARWPAMIVEGRTVPIPRAETTDKLTEAGPAKIAAGEPFTLAFAIVEKGPRVDYRVVELPDVTGLRMDRSRLRVLLPPEARQGEIRHSVAISAYADLPGPYPGLEVLAPGAPYRDGHVPKPMERLGAGRILFEAKQWERAKAMLLPLFDQGLLRDDGAVEAARLLTYAGVELGEPATVVRFFEILKEKSPEEVVSFDRIRAVAKAYASANEPERSMQVLTGTCDAYFLQEAAVAGALEDRGREREAASLLQSLLLEHPDTPLNREMLFGSAVELFGAAKAESRQKDPKRLSKEEKLAAAARALERLLARFPEAPDNDRAALTLGSVLLEAGAFPKAERVATSSAALWPKSRFVDGYDYVVAFARFAQKKYPEALAMCDRLETFDYGAHANPGPAVMRERAVLMKAQIHHAKGELDQALANYKKIRKTSEDAARSADFLEREAIAVPETTVAPLAKAAEIELEYAGVSEARVRVYKVDLVMLALRRKGAIDAASIEVAGIKPVFEKAYPLAAPNAKRREKQKLTLDLPAPGAYVVGVKAGDFFASGLVLRSDLAMTVQEDSAGLGTMRANVTNVAAGGFAEGVRVTVVDTPSGGSTTEPTDLRGIREAKNVTGPMVVVAERDGHVALHRGTKTLTARYANVFGANAAPQAGEALDKQLDANKSLEQQFKGNLRKQQEGVEVERTMKK